ncbi:S100P-binding protein isoform X2 [Lithobates pipiens]
MEDIKISIVNDRATGMKHKQDVAAVTPCSKKLRSVVFHCSTPHSASFPSWSSPISQSKGVRQSHASTAFYTLEQNPEFSDEWDDSLLEPSDNEDDSPLYLTVDEIESLLEDDSCFAGETSGLEKCNATCIVTPESEDKEKCCALPCSQLDGPNTFTKATLFEEDLDNFAAMAPSPCHSILHSVEVQVSKQKSNIVGNAKSSDSVQEINGLSTSAVPIVTNVEILTHQLASDGSANLPVQSPNSLYTIDVVEWKVDPELCFDGDIDNLLATSPRSGLSSEDDTAAEPSIQCTEQGRSVVSDSASTIKLLNAVAVNQTANSADSDSADIVQQLSPSTLNLSDTLKVHCPPSTVPEPPKDSESPSTSTMVISETQSTTDAVEDLKPSTSTESDATSTVVVSEQPENSSATQTSSSQQTITAPATNSSTAVQQRLCVAVTPLPKPAHSERRLGTSETTRDPTPSKEGGNTNTRSKGGGRRDWRNCHHNR